MENNFYPESARVKTSLQNYHRLALDYFLCRKIQNIHTIRRRDIRIQKYIRIYLSLFNTRWWNS